MHLGKYNDRYDRSRSLARVHMIVAIVHDRYDRWSKSGVHLIVTIAEKSVIFPKVHCSAGSFHADSDFAPKKMILEVF